MTIGVIHATVQRIRRVDQIYLIGVVGPVVGGQRIITEKFIYAAVELAGAALGYHADLRAAGAAGIGGVEAALHLELRNSVHAGKRHQRLVAAAIHIVRAVHCPVVRRIAVAVNRIGQGGRRSSGRRVADVKFVGRARGHAGHQRDQLLVVARAERQFANLLAIDDRGASRIAEFDGDRRLLHVDRLGDRADLQRDVDLQIVVHIERDPGAILRLEAGDLDLDRVGADGNQGR